MWWLKCHPNRPLRVVALLTTRWRSYMETRKAAAHSPGVVEDARRTRSLCSGRCSESPLLPTQHHVLAAPRLPAFSGAVLPCCLTLYGQGPFERTYGGVSAPVLPGAGLSCGVPWVCAPISAPVPCVQGGPFRSCHADAWRGRRSLCALTACPTTSHGVGPMSPAWGILSSTTLLRGRVVGGWFHLGPPFFAVHVLRTLPDGGVQQWSPSASGL